MKSGLVGENTLIRVLSGGQVVVINEVTRYSGQAEFQKKDRHCEALRYVSKLDSYDESWWSWLISSSVPFASLPCCLSAALPFPLPSSFPFCSFDRHMSMTQS